MLFDDNRLRFMSLCSFLHEEILIMQEKERLNEGEICINDEDDFVRNSILRLKDIFEEKGLTKKDLEITNLTFPRVKFYYDYIAKVIKRHIKSGEKWIPAIVILSCIQEFSLKGFKLFEDIKFFDCLDKYIFDKRAEHKFNFEIALDIVESLSNVQKPKISTPKRRKAKVC